MKKLSLLSGIVAAISVSAADYQIDDFKDLKLWKINWYGSGVKYSAAQGAEPGAAAMAVEAPGRVSKQLRIDNKERLQWPGKYRGISFLVKGDGSSQWGGVYLAGAGGDFCRLFPLDSKEFRRVVIAWEDFVSMNLHNPDMIGHIGSMPVSALDRICFGGPLFAKGGTRAPRYHFTVADLRLAEKAEPEYVPGRFKPSSFVAFQEKLRSGKAVKIYSFGDSITYGTSTSNPETDRYPAQLEKLLRRESGNNSVEVFGRGIGGADTRDMLYQMPRDLDENADCLTFMIGYNNKSRGQSAASYRATLVEWIERAAAKTKGRAAIVLMTPIPCIGPRYAINADYVRVVKEVAKEYNLGFCDFFSAFDAVEKSGFPALFADGVHPKASGHAILARALADVILKK